MTGAELLIWREKLNLSKTAAAKELGVTLKTYRGMEDGKLKISRTVGLAASAIIMDLREWGDYRFGLITEEQRLGIIPIGPIFAPAKIKKQPD